MNPDVFAEWLRCQNHKVVRTLSTYWVEVSPRVFQAFPYHWIITPCEDEIMGFLHDQGATCLRYSTPVTALEGAISYHSVLCDRSYSLAGLSANSRSKVRRGQRRCRIEQISLDRLAHDGWQLQQDTLARQGRSDSMSQIHWHRICLAAKGLPGFEVWAAYVDRDLAATILTAQVEDTCYMLYPQSHRKYFGEYVNNALSYAVTRDMLSRSDVKEIFYGLHSLDAPPSVDEFKFRMGYHAKPVRQKVECNPLIRRFINTASYSIVKFCHSRLPSNSMLAKAEGMIRFYLQGKLPPSRQAIPGPLQNVISF